MRVTTGTGTGTCRGRRRNAEADAEAASSSQARVSQAQNGTRIVPTTMVRIYLSTTSHHGRRAVTSVERSGSHAQ